MGKVSEWITTYACNLLNLLIDKIDVIFYTQPEDVPLVADGTRSVDLNFRQDIINRYEDLFAQDYYWMDKVVRLSGTVEDRMGTILETIQYENSDIRQFQNI
jgi:nicotinamide riboside kinase